MNRLQILKSNCLYQNLSHWYLSVLINISVLISYQLDSYCVFILCLHFVFPMYTFANFWFVLCLVRLGQLLAQIHLPCCPAFYCSMYFTLCFALRIKWWWWWWWSYRYYILVQPTFAYLTHTSQRAYYYNTIYWIAATNVHAVIDL